MDSYDKAINIEPNNARHWNSKGTALYHLQRYQGALDSYNKAISIDPGNPVFQKNKDILLKQMGSAVTTTSTPTNMTGASSTQLPQPSQPQGGNMSTASPPPSSPSSTAMLNYENPDFGIKMQYPSNWIKKATVRTTGTSTTIASFSPPTTGGLVEVFVVKYAHVGGMSLQEYLDGIINSRKDMADFKILDAKTDATLANQPAYLLITNTGSEPFQTREVGTIIGDNAYVVRYVADSAKYFTYLHTNLQSFFI